MPLMIYCQNRAESENKRRLLRRRRSSFSLINVGVVCRDRVQYHSLVCSVANIMNHVSNGLPCERHAYMFHIIAHSLVYDHNTRLSAILMFHVVCHGVGHPNLSSPMDVMYPVDVDRHGARYLVISRTTRLVSGFTTSFDPPFVMSLRLCAKSSGCN